MNPFKCGQIIDFGGQNCSQVTEIKGENVTLVDANCDRTTYHYRDLLKKARRIIDI